MSIVMITIVVVIMLMITFFAILMVHELGHYIMGKIFNVPIAEINIGQGPLIYKSKGGIPLSLRILPTKGYVAVEEKAYRRLNRREKILISAAGAIGNFILSFVCILLILIDHSILNNPGTSFIPCIAIFSLGSGIVDILPDSGNDGEEIFSKKKKRVK